MSILILYNGTVYTGVTKIEKSTVVIKDGKIDDVFSNKRFHQKKFPSDAKIYDLEGAGVAPGFIDTHIHGLHGFGTEDNTKDAIIGMSEALVEYGVTSFCPTIYPQADEDFLKSIRAVAKAKGKENGANILGMHLEGPFISPKKRGVQKPESIKKVDLELMESYWKAAEGHISNMTVAPELKGMREMALYCNKKGIVLQAGHSNAHYDNMREGMEAGITHTTHFLNAMRGLHHRDPGVAGAVLIHPEVSCEIIADGCHLHPATVQLLVSQKMATKIVLVTDALRPTCQTSGKLLANNEEVYKKEGLFHRKKDDVIAGSCLTMNKGVKNLVSYGVSMRDALMMASGNPATVLNYNNKIGSLLPGRDADVVVFNKKMDVLTTIVKGKIKKNEL